MVLPRSGDVLHVTRAASVQFAEPMLFRVIRVHDWLTYDGWVWLDGYQLNAAGDAVQRRSIFVQISGLKQVSSAPDLRTRNSRSPAAQSGGRAAPGGNLPSRRVMGGATRDNGTNVRSVR